MEYAPQTPIPAHASPPSLVTIASINSARNLVQATESVSQDNVTARMASKARIVPILPV